MSDGSHTPPPPEPSSQRKHVPPPWAGTPTEDYSLEVIKDGAVIQTLPINDRDHFVLGRQPDVCDILMDHPSISRQHAALQFNGQNELFVMDLGSAHGTFLNKERLQPKVFNRVPVSSVLKFGESTRLYVVHGPDYLMPSEDTSEALERSRAESEKRQQRKAKERERAEQRRKDLEAGCNWGFAEDAFEDEEEEDEGNGEGAIIPDSYDHARRRDTSEEELLGGQEGRMFRPKPTSLAELTRKATEAAGGVHEADSQLFERMLKRRQKIENLQSEVTRIKTKAGNEGLTEGQQHHVRKVEEKIEELQRQVEDNEETLRQRNQQRQASTSKAKKRANGDDDYDSEEDEFFDRTIVAKRLKSGKEQSEAASPKAAVPAAAAVETWESLSAKAESLDKHITGVEARIASQQASSSSPAATSVSPAADELDAFMQSNDVVYASDTLQALQSELATLKAERGRVERLLTLAKPALSGLKARAPVDHAVPLPTSPKSPGGAVPPACTSKPLTGIDKKQAYWKEKMTKASRATGALSADVAVVEKKSEDKPSIGAHEALEAAAPKHAGLGSGPFASSAAPVSKPANPAVAAMKAAVNRLPGSAEVVSSYKPGLNAMK